MTRVATVTLFWVALASLSGCSRHPATKTDVPLSKADREKYLQEFAGTYCERGIIGQPRSGAPVPRLALRRDWTFDLGAIPKAGLHFATPASDEFVELAPNGFLPSEC